MPASTARSSIKANAEREKKITQYQICDIQCRKFGLEPSYFNIQLNVRIDFATLFAAAVHEECRISGLFLRLKLRKGQAMPRPTRNTSPRLLIGLKMDSFFLRKQD